MSYNIKINNPQSAWNEKSDGSVKQALRRQCELVDGIAASQLFVNNFGEKVANDICALSRSIREGNLDALSALMPYASKCGRVSALPSSIAVLQHYVQRMRAAVATGEEHF